MTTKGGPEAKSDEIVGAAPPPENEASAAIPPAVVQAEPDNERVPMASQEVNPATESLPVAQLLALGSRALGTLDKAVETGVREAEIKSESKKTEIDAWREDRKDDRNFRFKREILGAILAGIPVFSLVGVACFLLVTGKKEEAYWILSLLVIGGGGGGTGYVVGFNRGRREEQEARRPNTSE